MNRGTKVDFSLVVALQYYNACQVLLRQHKPPDHSLRGFEAVREQRNAEVKIPHDYISQLELTHHPARSHNSSLYRRRSSRVQRMGGKCKLHSSSYAED